MLNSIKTKVETASVIHSNEWYRKDLLRIASKPKGDILVKNIADIALKPKSQDKNNRPLEN